jgi:hypothetical protein
MVAKYTLEQLLKDGKETSPDLDQDVEFARGYKNWSMKLDLGKDILGRDEQYEKEIYSKWGDDN